MWVNVELWSCVAVSRWCFVYNMHQINIHNGFHKSTFFFKTVTERKIFFLVLSELFAFSCWSVITILYVLETSAFSSGCFLTNVRFITWSGKTEGNWAQNSSLLYTCMLLHLCDPSPRKGYNVCFFFMSGKTKSLFWFRPFKNCLGCSQNRKVFIPLLLLFW